MPPDDLTDLERRLTGWRPNPAGLNPDAMLFAAGRAAARPWRAWLALAPCLAALAVAVAAWASERAERVALAEQLRQRAPAPALVPPDEPTFDEPGPNSFLTAHRALEYGLEAWPPQPIAAPKTPAPEPTVLEAGRRGTLLDP